MGLEKSNIYRKSLNLQTVHKFIDKNVCIIHYTQMYLQTSEYKH